MNSPVKLFFRKKRIGVNSIESVFQSIDPNFIEHKNETLPHEGGSPLIILKNILFAKKEPIKLITSLVMYIILS